MQRPDGLAALFALVLIILLGGVSYAQESRSTLSGTVADPAGLVVPGTEVTLTNSQTGVVTAVRTNDAGQYRFLFVNPGMYRLSVQSTGFRSFTRENIQLKTNIASVIDVTLQIGDVADRITVTSEAPLLEAEKGDRGLV